MLAYSPVLLGFAARCEQLASKGDPIADRALEDMAYMPHTAWDRSRAIAVMIARFERYDREERDRLAQVA